MEIKFRPIGVVHTKGSDAEVRDKGGELEGEIGGEDARLLHHEVDVARIAEHVDADGAAEG